MKLRRHLAVVTLASIALAACGEDDASSTANSGAPADTDAATASDAPTVTEGPTDTGGATETAAPTDTGEPSGDEPSSGRAYEHPTGADEAVVSLTNVGGFTMARVSFSMAPNLVISGDGMVYTPAATTAIFPGVLVPPMQVQTISEEGIQEVLAAAEEAGLLAEVDYEDEGTELIADAPTTVLTISADGEVWEHSAYALGFQGAPGSEEELSPERQMLQGFVDDLSDLAALAGAANLGDAELYVPDDYEIVAMPVEDPAALAVDGIEPTVVDWPADAGLALTDAGACTRIDADAVGGLFEEANELTLFSEDEVTFEVWARPVLPGRTCDA